MVHRVLAGGWEGCRGAQSAVDGQTKIIPPAKPDGRPLKGAKQCARRGPSPDATEYLISVNVKSGKLTSNGGLRLSTVTHREQDFIIALMGRAFCETINCRNPKFILILPNYTFCIQKNALPAVQMVFAWHPTHSRACDDGENRERPKIRP